ncbi:hypothetical protein [Agrobacterium tumefaciens]|uniref:NADH:ubiquinone oxidoreductase subunit B-like Fe-S oxidoreductase n=1 Tax=Agrobacterium tumefaciens TaxID=358 RepID=A0AAW8LVD8_AGRTU|nr:hypothetical protein [Agrobacterium tumefaciens]MDR6703005.1 NADH:ubiquinone oxidoreductase subunit B-like Fe-S oxidoreductase [Agrobacterium tumefaciens]
MQEPEHNKNMLKSEVDQNFEIWWQTVRGVTEQDKSRMRVAFVAGCRFIESAKPKTYRFQSGRWVVSVKATSKREAKMIASAKLTQRATKLLASPPPGGWKLRELEAH